MLSGGIPPCNDPGTIDDETMKEGRQITEGKVEGRETQVATVVVISSHRVVNRGE